jgi:hypothetical protein
MADDSPVESYFIDRFGPVLVTVVVTIAMLLVVNLPRRGSATSIAEVAVTVLTGMTLLLALLASGSNRPLLRVGIFVVVGFVLWSLISLFSALDSVAILRVLWFLLVVTTPYLVLRRLAAHPAVTTETLLGAASVFLLIAVMFMFLFLAIDTFDPGEFFGVLEPTTAFMYFSLVTVTTLGYGDLAPQTDLARAMSVFGAVIGQVYLVFIVARLVALGASAASGRRGPFEPPPRIDREQG